MILYFDEAKSAESDQKIRFSVIYLGNIEYRAYIKKNPVPSFML